jgi:hypothetical protein
VKLLQARLPDQCLVFLNTIPQITPQYPSERAITLHRLPAAAWCRRSTLFQRGGPVCYHAHSGLLYATRLSTPERR